MSQPIGLPSGFRVSSSAESFFVSSEWEGANASRAAALATWVMGSRRTIDQLAGPLGELGFPAYLLDRRPGRSRIRFGGVGQFGDRLSADERRVEAWGRFADAGTLDRAADFLVQLLLSSLERESAAAAAALWRVRAWSRGFAGRPARRLLPPPGFWSDEALLEPDYDDEDDVPWDGDSWAMESEWRLRGMASPHPNSIMALVERRLDGALRSSDETTRQIAAAAFLSMEPGPPPEVVDRSHRGSSDVSTMVHGTWAWVKDWWEPGGNFFDFAHGGFRSNLFQLGTRFSWSGACRARHRARASSRFSDWAREVAPKGLSTVFAHSYGGEVVANSVVSGLGVDELVLLSVPVTPNVAVVADCTRVVDVRLAFDIVLGLTGYGQRLAPHPNVTEVVLRGWDWQHGASHDPTAWQRQNVVARGGL